jgi:hypothetical protein
VAIRTNDIAFRDLLEQYFAASTDASRNPKQLLPRISVIEVHRGGRKILAAVETRHGTDFVEKSRVCLPAPSRSFQTRRVPGRPLLGRHAGFTGKELGVRS